MLDFCIGILSLFFVPFQQAFADSLFFSVFYICLVFVPVLMLLKVWRWLV